MREGQGEESKPQPDCFQIVEESKVVTNFDVIEVDHIDFVILEYSVKSPSLVNQISKFFTPQPFFENNKKFIFIIVLSCMVLAFYKTRGRDLEFSLTRGE